ncbi:MAG TPA: transcriptional regulator, partial [Bacteroidales bacterium]|nr:transcriptional regulator [Bacteroidales bacterium]
MRENSIFKKRILQYLEFKNITKYEFYQKTGISNGILSQTNGLTEDSILKFLSYYTDVNPSWLLTGGGEMITNNQTKEYTNTVNEPKSTYNTVDKKQIITAGDLLDRIEKQSEEIGNLKAQIQQLTSKK